MLNDSIENWEEAFRTRSTHEIDLVLGKEKCFCQWRVDIFLAGGKSAKGHWRGHRCGLHGSKDRGHDCPVIVSSLHCTSKPTRRTRRNAVQIKHTDATHRLTLVSGVQTRSPHKAYTEGADYDPLL